MTIQPKITASVLYDYLQCAHRPWRDIYGPKEELVEADNAFLKLLWERGVQHEQDVISGLGTFLDLSGGSLDERKLRTLKALERRTPLIYQGVLQSEDLLGIPDLLELQGDGSYMPVDIKSGSAYEGADPDTKKFKKHYAVQLCLYSDLISKLGFGNSRKGKIIDIHGEMEEYDLDQPQGKRNTATWWSLYQELKSKILPLLLNQEKNKPALGGVCKLCNWHDSCLKWLKATKDPTNLFYLGRSVRDTLERDLGVSRLEDLLNLDEADILSRKKADRGFLKGVGESSLTKYINRARISVVTKKPEVQGSYQFPEVGYELFFDIEDDPTLGFVYMHGVYERTNAGEKYLHFTATEKSEEAERVAWKRFWDYIKSLPEKDFAVYYYSHHEKTTYRKMQAIYPDVISEDEVSAFFGNQNVIDLYQVVQSQTEWPLSSYSIKAIATYLGFKWRDESPSGALSIQWFNEYLKTRDDSILKRILEYNEDDCKATMVLKDGLENLFKVN
ncbi:TM0106 family RecB-like putative nuclease [Fibrobacterota bacterium]